MERKRYSSDLQERDWQYIALLIPIARTSKWSLLEVVNAILYWLKNDCTWQDLPGDFPPWNTVNYYFKKWSEDGTWKAIDAHLTDYYGERVPYRKRKKSASTKVIIDLGWIKNKPTSAHSVREPVAAIPCFCGSTPPRAQ